MTAEQQRDLALQIAPLMLRIDDAVRNATGEHAAIEISGKNFVARSDEGEVTFQATLLAPVERFTLNLQVGTGVTINGRIVPEHPQRREPRRP